MENKIVKEIISWLLYLGTGLIVAILLINFVFRFTVVKGDSMISTLKNNDILYIDKISYTIGTPKRGDIIVCNYPDLDGNFIKRIIGLPGETVEISDGTVYINGVAGVDQWNGFHHISDMKAVKIPKDSYFVMGDNRSNSKDSRDTSVGTIYKSEILGKAMFRVFPIDKFGSINYEY